jgi:enoyl-[acyl-carrier protein] reductase II
LNFKYNLRMNRVCNIFNIKYPIVQGGMVWCSGWRLASAVSNAGGLGVIGAGSMHPEVFREHIIKCKKATNKPFGVNLPLLYPQMEEMINIIIEEEVKIVITSAGNPAKYTSFFKEKGITVVHVIANSKFALKAEQAGVDAIVAEGFEAGGHNGREETTTIALIPMIKDIVKVPVIAAGGIANGNQMAAAMALGADGVQVGSKFAITEESSAHSDYKQCIVNCKDGDTILTLKSVVPVRLVKNDFCNRVEKMIQEGNSVEELREELGRGRAKRGIFEGDLSEGEVEIGQVSAMINSIEKAEDVVHNMINEYNTSINSLKEL